MPTTRYVATTGNDTTGDGSTGNPYLTIGKADSVAVAGDTVIVRAGVYSPVAGVTTVAQGTAGNPITFRSETKWGAIIRAAAANTALYGWRNGSDSGNLSVGTIGKYQIIDGFDIDCTFVSGTRQIIGIYGTGDHVTCKNLKVHDLVTGGVGGALAELDGYYGGQNGVIDSCLCYHIDGGSTAHGQGLYLSQRFNVVKNNVVGNCTDVGIQLWHGASDCTVVNNTVFNHSIGILIGSGDLGAGTFTGTFTNGLLTVTGIASTATIQAGTNIAVYGLSGIPAGTSVQTVNSGTQITMSAAFTGTSGSHSFTVNNTDGSHYWSFGNNNTVCFNNITYSGVNYGIQEIADAASGGAIGTNFFGNNDSFSNTVANWSLVNSQGSNNLTASPLFANYLSNGTGNYHLTSGSPCVNGGASSLNAVAAPTTDLDGNVRPRGSAYDIGAYEYGVLIPLLAGAAANGGMADLIGGMTS